MTQINVAVVNPPTAQKLRVKLSTASGYTNFKNVSPLGKQKVPGNDKIKSDSKILTFQGATLYNVFVTEKKKTRSADIIVVNVILCINV